MASRHARSYVLQGRTSLLAGWTMQETSCVDVLFRWQLNNVIQLACIAAQQCYAGHSQVRHVNVLVSSEDSSGASLSATALKTERKTQLDDLDLVKELGSSNFERDHQPNISIIVRESHKHVAGARRLCRRVK